MTTQIDVNTKLNDVSIKDLLGYSEFTSGLIDKMRDTFATKEEVNTSSANKINSAMENYSNKIKLALEDKADKNGGNIDVHPFSTKLAEKLATKEAVDLANLSNLLTNDDKSQIKIALGSKANNSDLNKYVSLDSINSDKGKKFAEEIFNVKGQETDPKSILVNKLIGEFATSKQIGDVNKTIGLLRANKAALKDLDKYIKSDGSNIKDQQDGGKALVDAILSVKDPDNNVLETFAENVLAKKFAKRDVSNIEDNSDGVKALAETLLSAKTNPNNKETIAENVLAGKFATKKEVNELMIDDSSPIKIALDNKANKDGTNIDVDLFSTKLALKFATAEQLNDKADKSALDNKADIAALDDKADKSALDDKADKSALDNKANSSDLDKYVELDGTNIATHTDKGKALATAILNIKAAPGDGSKTVFEDALAGKFVSEGALDTFAKSDGSNIDVKQFSITLTTDKDSAIKTALDDKADKSALDDKADKSALDNKIDKDGGNIDVDLFSTKLAPKFATAEQLNDKADKSALNDFARLDGTNADKGAPLFKSILDVKENQNKTHTILEEKLAKIDPKIVDTSQYVRYDSISLEQGKDLATTIFAMKSEDSEKTIFATELENQPIIQELVNYHEVSSTANLV